MENKEVRQKLSYILGSNEFELIKKLNGGMMNESYLFSYQGNKYIVYFPFGNANDLVDRNLEKANQEIVSSLGIGPKNYYFDTKSGIKINTFIEGESLNLVNEYDINKVATLFKALHHSKTLSEVHYSPFVRFVDYENNRKEVAEDTKEYLELRDYLFSKENFLKENEVLVLSHNDAQKSNIIKTNDEYKLIDFEFMANNDEIYDIAAFGNGSVMEGYRLLEAYYSTYQEISEIVKQKYFLWRLFISLQWYNVAISKHYNGEGKIHGYNFLDVASFFFNNALECYRRIKHYDNRVDVKRKIVNIPFLGYKTHCEIYGDIYKSTPLIILHGGPGGCVEKYESLIELSRYGVPLVMYDQFGCGYSKIKDDKSLYKVKTYIDELNNLISYLKLDKYNILGHSWGGMLLLEAITQKKLKGLNKVILFSTLPSTKIWNDEHLEMVKDYDAFQKEALLNELNNLPYNKKAHKLGIKRFYKEHLGTKKDVKYIRNRKRCPKINKHIYEYMWGPSELFGTGTLKDYDVTNRLESINYDTLIIHGRLDESTTKMNLLMHERIKNSKYIRLESSHHGGYNEEPLYLIETLLDYLK